jgi:adenosylcobinamide-GDP ribazoletransferase
MKRVLRPAAAAITFLTSAPLGRLVQVEPQDVARGAWAFPVVGGVVGGLTGLVADVLADWLPSLAAGVLAVAVAGLLTGAMHLDALGDTADALGAPTRVRALEIMRDHAIGAFGATALIVVLVLDAVVLGALGQSGDAALVGLAAGAAGRAAMLPPALALSYARTEEGQGRLLDDLSGETVVLAIAFAGVLAVPAGVAGLWGAVAAAFTATALGLFAWRRFGGVTGDVLGATGKLAESAALVAGVAVVT